MGVTLTVREVACEIAARPVRAVLRRGGSFGGPPTTYVRCSERTCQYTDINQAPCPLRVELFEMQSHRLVAERVSGSTEPTCLACIALTLHVSHDDVRRGLWPLCDHGLVRFRAGRCRMCGHRGVVAHAARPRPPRAARGATETRVATARTSADDRSAVTGRVRAWLTQAAGDAYCPGCLALAVRASLEEVRRLFAATGPLHTLVAGAGACSSCGREQPFLATTR